MNHLQRNRRFSFGNDSIAEEQEMYGKGMKWPWNRREGEEKGTEMYLRDRSSKEEAMRRWGGERQEEGGEE